MYDPFIVGPAIDSEDKRRKYQETSGITPVFATRERKNPNAGVGKLSNFIAGKSPDFSDRMESYPVPCPKCERWSFFSEVQLQTCSVSCLYCGKTFGRLWGD